jgi:hypothetical protein
MSSLRVLIRETARISPMSCSWSLAFRGFIEGLRRVARA